MNAERTKRYTEASYWEKRGKKYAILEEAKAKRRKTVTVEHLLANPEESRQEFFEKYLRQILKRDMDPFVKAKYREYATKIKEVPLGTGFLERMENDIEKRSNNNRKKTHEETCDEEYEEI